MRSFGDLRSSCRSCATCPLHRFKPVLLWQICAWPHKAKYVQPITRWSSWHRQVLHLTNTTMWAARAGGDTRGGSVWCGLKSRYIFYGLTYSHCLYIILIVLSSLPLLHHLFASCTCMHTLTHSHAHKYTHIHALTHVQTYTYTYLNFTSTTKYCIS